ncbi:hypothetical protein I204_04975 [Kwoniella mangroviensis CBS 8886]|uniref:uncharacterized protein n=1 Tax=Kwoniella mangroviensis CBS 8507 TaxID=1296122 RepID=UPI00080D8167|nr:uncharacterized protein I203_06389 [Kwoniella mangroviensis CBS 8507]OCF64654.1 hypothetical protein I203_06389 [Kwoniella mangroviensis CBS 8507]OCF74596.1 hypothetical protein I204_04975 [Kwoniella mangroviensis CBS 8886]
MSSSITKEAEPWVQPHTQALLRGMVQIILQHRTELYTLPSLCGVSNNHGDRIRKKTHHMLKQFCELYPGSEGLVEEEIKNLNGMSRSGGGSPKKRKIKDEE